LEKDKSRCHSTFLRSFGRDNTPPKRVTEPFKKRPIAVSRSICRTPRSGSSLRRGHDWTKRFRKIAKDAWHIDAGSGLIDGEVVAPAEDGTTDFAVLQNELKGRPTRIARVAFDLLYFIGRDLRRLPLHERKAQLQKLIAVTAVQFSESFAVDGAEMFRHACKTGLEGVISKVAEGRSPFEPSHYSRVQSHAGGLQFPVREQRHQALLSLGRCCFREDCVKLSAETIQRSC
jgi:hypothetical protein